MFYVFVYNGINYDIRYKCIIFTRPRLGSVIYLTVTVIIIVIFFFTINTQGHDCIGHWPGLVCYILVFSIS